MRKQFKKVLSMVLSAAMVLTLGSGVSMGSDKVANAETGSTKAFIGVSQSSWAWGIGGLEDAEAAEKDGNAVLPVVDSDGTYTVSYTLPAKEKVSNFNYLAVRLPGLDDQFSKDAAGNTTTSAITFSDVELKLDGAAQEADWDLGGDGDARISFIKWGQAGNASYKDVEVEKIEVTFTVEGTGWTKPVQRPTEETSGTPDEILNSEGIHAYLSYQTSAWDHRNNYEAGSINKESGMNYIQGGGQKSYDSDWFTVKDVLLDHDGEYTVSIDDIDLTNADYFNWLSVSTDLLVESYPGVTATLSAVTIDGEAVEGSTDKPFLVRDEDEYYHFMAANAYAQTSADADEWKDPDAAAPLFVSQVPMPEKSVAITFTIAGLEEALTDIDNGTYVQPDNGDTEKPVIEYPPKNTPGGNTPAPGGNTPAPGGNTPAPGGNTPAPGGNTPAPGGNTPAPGGNTPGGTSPSPTPAGNGGTTDAVVGAKVGASVTVGAFKLKVTKAATAKSAGTATVTGLSKSGKKAKALNVKASMKSGAASYKVNKLGKNAFKGAKATKITLSKSINSIPAGAFANCKALKTLTLNAKLKKVTKKAFKGCKKKIAVKGKGKKANVKLLKKSGYKKFK